MAGLHNVVAVRGDPIRGRDRVKSVNDYTTTALLSDISRMNRGRDFRGLSLTNPTSFCPGATVDIGRGIEAEAALAARKSAAGSGIPTLPGPLHRRRRERPSTSSRQALRTDPDALRRSPNTSPRWDRLRQRSGPSPPGARHRQTRPGHRQDLALELRSLGVTNFYVIPTILRGGMRRLSHSRRAGPVHKVATRLLSGLKSLTQFKLTDIIFPKPM